MKFSQKLILIPEEKYKALLSKEGATPPASPEKNSEEDKLHKDRPSSSNSLQQEQKHNLPEVDADEGNGPPIQLEGRLDPAIVLSTIPKLLRNKVGSLLTQIQSHPNPVLDWDSQGQLLFHDHIIPGSHISVILKHVMKPGQTNHLPGVKEFKAALREMKLPIDHIAVPEERRKLQTKTAHSTTAFQPPPGKRKKVPKRIVKWLEFK